MIEEIRDDEKRDVDDVEMLNRAMEADEEWAARSAEGFMMMLKEDWKDPDLVEADDGDDI